MLRYSIVLACAGALTSCMDAIDDPEVSTTAEDIVGPMLTPPAEIYFIKRESSLVNKFTLAFRVRDNLAIGPYMQPNPSLSDVVRYQRTRFGTVFNVSNGSTAQTLPGLGVYTIPESGTANRIDTRSAAALASITLECWGLKETSSNHWEPRAVLYTVTGGTGDTLTASPVVGTEFLETTDVGVPCITTTTPRLLSGVVKTVDAATHAATFHRGGGLEYWFAGLANLAMLMSDSRKEGPFAIWTDPAVIGASRMCFDIPFGDPRAHTFIQQYPCHYQTNQLFWIDHTAPTGAEPRLVSAASGRCLDIEFGDAMIGRHLQEYDCHDGTNQKFVLRNNRNNGQIAAVSGVPSNLCEAVNGGPTTAAANIVQKTCVGTAFAFQEQWTFDPRTLPRF